MVPFSTVLFVVFPALGRVEWPEDVTFLREIPLVVLLRGSEPQVILGNLKPGFGGVLAHEEVRLAVQTVSEPLNVVLRVVFPVLCEVSVLELFSDMALFQLVEDSSFLFQGAFALLVLFRHAVEPRVLQNLPDAPPGRSWNGLLVALLLFLLWVGILIISFLRRTFQVEYLSDQVLAAH